jgi:hypothetical protein
MTMKKIAIVSFIVLIYCSNAWAQHDTRGTDFWVCFPQNAKHEAFAGLNFKLYITSDTPAKGIVTGLGSKQQNFSVEAGKVIVVDVDTSAQVLGSDRIQNLGIHVQSDQPIAVYGLSNRKASTDTYVAFPTNVLGKSYRALCYHGLGADDQFTSQIDIIATDDKTIIAIVPTSKTKGGKEAGQQINLLLNRGDVYQIQGASGMVPGSDLTGTLVTSNKPVAFFTGHTCAQVPATVNFCDMLLEEVPPLNTWGKQFFVSKLLGKGEFAVRVVANEDNTKVFENEKLVATLAAGNFYENNHEKDNVLITSDKPVLVGQFAQSAEADSVKVGDPFLMLIAPTEQYLSSYRFATPIKGDWHHYINIVVPIGGMNSLRLDNTGISADKFKPIGITRFAIAQLEISYGSHMISCDRPFGLYSYGFGTAGDNYDSYGNCAGQRVAPIERIADSSKPTLEIAQSDSASYILLIARDDRINDLGLASIMITDSSNINNPISYPTFDVGAPEFRFKVNKVTQSNCIYIRLQDFAKNISNYALCPVQPNIAGTSNEGGRYNITPVLYEEQAPHEIYAVDVYPSPAKYGQPVNIDFTNSMPEIIAVQVLDEGGNIVTELQQKQLTGAGKHSLTYISNNYTTGNYFLRFFSYAQNGQVLYKQDAHFIVIK